MQHIYNELLRNISTKIILHFIVRRDDSKLVPCVHSGMPTYLNDIMVRAKSPDRKIISCSKYNSCLVKLDAAENAVAWVRKHNTFPVTIFYTERHSEYTFTMRVYKNIQFHETLSRTHCSLVENTDANLNNCIYNIFMCNIRVAVPVLFVLWWPTWCCSVGQ